MSVQEAASEGLAKFTNDQLREQIAHELRWWEESIKAIRLLARDHGELTHYDQGSDYTHTIYRLSSFFDFTIDWESWRRYQSGGDLRIWYHPEMAFDEQMPPNCKVHYPYGVTDPNGMAEKNFKVVLLDRSLDWKTPLQNVLENHEAMLAEKKRIAEEEQQKRQQELLAKAEREALLEQAERLKIG